MKTSDLLGPALDWAVAKCEGIGLEWSNYIKSYWIDSIGCWLPSYSPSTDWAQGDPIIDREKIAIYPMPGKVGGAWRAEWVDQEKSLQAIASYKAGPTPP